MKKFFMIIFHIGAILIALSYLYGIHELEKKRFERMDEKLDTLTGEDMKEEFIDVI